MQSFILAGGFATRLWPLTERRPKPLLPLAGKPILTHLLEKIPVDIPVTVSTNAAFEAEFRTWVALQDRTIDLIIEDTTKDDHKLGALGAIAQWIKTNNIDDDLLVLTGDNYLGFSLSEFLNTFNGHPLLAAYDVQDLAKASAFGTVILEQGIVKAFEEKPQTPKSTLVSSGCSILPKQTLPLLLEYAAHHPDNVGGIFEEYLRRSIAVDCFVFTETWMDIGSFTSYLDAHRLLVAGNALVDPSASSDRSPMTGSVSIGKKSRVIGSELHDCMIFDDCRIENCVLRDCIVDDGCVLRGVDLTGKMIRAGTTLVTDIAH